MQVSGNNMHVSCNNMHVLDDSTADINCHITQYEKSVAIQEISTNTQK